MLKMVIEMIMLMEEEEGDEEEEEKGKEKKGNILASKPQDLEFTRTEILVM